MANPSTYQQVVQLTATVRASSKGTLGTATLNGAGQAVLRVSKLSSGAHSITASDGGNSQYLGSRSAAITQMVK